MPKGLTLRKVQRTGNSLTVALPPAAVRVLRARAGRPVQVVVGRRGTVIVAPVSRRIGVRQEYEDLVSQLKSAHREAAHWRKKARGRPLRIFREGHAQGMMQAHTARFLDLDVLLDYIRRLVVATEALPSEPTPRSGADPDPPRKSTRSGAAAHVQSPDPSPSLDGGEGGGVGAGGTPPGQP